MNPHCQVFSLVASVVLLPLATVPAHGEFSGSDSLMARSTNWVESYHDSNKNHFVFRNERLEFQRLRSDTQRYFRWTPNQGSLDQDWFIQANVHSTTRSSIGIAALNTASHKKGYMMSINRSNKDGFEGQLLNGNEHTFTRNSSTSVSLRIHYDSGNQTITGSWKTRLSWHYFKPVRINKLDMAADDTFTACLTGDLSSNEDTSEPYDNLRPGNADVAYFKNFKCGTATPEIVVETSPTTRLIDQTGKISFGTAKVGGDSVTRTLTIRNEGTTKLSHLEIREDGAAPADFRVARLSKTTLEPGSSFSLKITFQPTATGLRKAALHLLSNDPVAGSFDISLSGLGAES